MRWLLTFASVEGPRGGGDHGGDASGADFTVADIMMAGVLRGVRKTDLLAPFPKTTSYYERCFARPAWQRTLDLYAERLGVSVNDIR